MALDFKIDTITKHGEEFVAYIHVMSGRRRAQAISIQYKDEEDFKRKFAKRKADILGCASELDDEKAKIAKIMKGA